MSWMQRLYETYETVRQQKDKFAGQLLPAPPAHVEQQAHIEITIDGHGNFKRAEVLNKETTLIPATEASAGRTSGGEPHPLCDKLQYVAGDYQVYGGISSSYFDDFKSGAETKAGYLSLISAWEAYYPHPMLCAVKNYVSKREVIKDLVAAKILFVDEKGRLLTLSEGDDTPPIFKVLQKKKDKETKENVYDIGAAFVRWKVSIPGTAEDRVWKSEELINSWTDFTLSRQTNKSLCFISGKESAYAVNHPARIRHAADKAKLISSNDKDGLTFRGRFVNPEECCTVSYEVTQKAHAALRWLIERQSFRSDTQVIVAWAVNAVPIPQIVEGTDELLGPVSPEQLNQTEAQGKNSEDIGQEYALKLKKKIAGYKALLKERDDIVVMSLDSATPGRMAVTYYREIKGSEFLARVEDYHSRYAWPQFFGKERQFIGAPSIDEIAKRAYASKISAELLKSTVSRLLPTIVDGAPMPRDLIISLCRRAASPMSMEKWEYERILGMACALYSGTHKERGYQMSLEENRNTRDYLFGRLLAVADYLEDKALAVAGETRETSAMKLMQIFSERPASTWLQIEKNLNPYMGRLRSRRPKQLHYLRGLLDKIPAQFQEGDFENDSRLSPEFLLGYHCQRGDLYKKKEASDTEDTNTENKNTQEADK